PCPYSCLLSFSVAFVRFRHGSSSKVDPFLRAVDPLLETFGKALCQALDRGLRCFTVCSTIGDRGVPTDIANVDARTSLDGDLHVSAVLALEQLPGHVRDAIQSGHGSLLSFGDARFAAISSAHCLAWRSSS